MNKNIISGSVFFLVMGYNFSIVCCQEKTENSYFKPYYSNRSEVFVQNYSSHFNMGFYYIGSIRCIGLLGNDSEAEYFEKSKAEMMHLFHSVKSNLIGLPIGSVSMCSKKLKPIYPYISGIEVMLSYGVFENIQEGRQAILNAEQTCYNNDQGMS